MVLTFKKIAATTVVSGALLALAFNNVFAATDSWASVGDDGDSYTYSDDSDSFNVDNHNGGFVGNLDLGLGVSGFNSQDHGDDENYMETGSADGFAGSDNFLNSNASVLGDDSEGSAVSDATVGEDGNASAEAFDNDSFRVRNHNRGSIENFTIAAAVSGFNSQHGNDDGNELRTGESLAYAHSGNELNSNWTWIEEGHSAYSSASVADDGDSYALADDSDWVRVFNRNYADLDNVSVAIAVSGGNNQSHNDDDNVLETQGSLASSSVSNYVNSNVTVVGSDDSHHDSSSAAASAETGEDGNASSESFDNDSITVANANSAEVENVSVAAGVSGGNSQSDNDDGNHMVTGASSGSSCSSNAVNSNWTVIGGQMPEGGEVDGCSVAY